MKWFDRWFARKCEWAWDEARKIQKQEAVPTIMGEEDRSWGDGLRINLKKVVGGYVVSFRTYDRVKDRSDERHYIITDEQEFEKELGKIITLESMRQT